MGSRYQKDDYLNWFDRFKMNHSSFNSTQSTNNTFKLKMQAQDKSDTRISLFFNGYKHKPS